MKRRALIAAAASALLLLVWAVAQVPATSPADLPRLTPAGPLLYLEAKDFGALLSDWNGSQEKQLWLKSDNFQVFSRSRLYLKLDAAQTEFAAAAGLPPDMALLGNVAGTRSALAIYDIGKLEFLYITRMPASRFAGGSLWKTRGSFQPRQSSGLDYYIKTDPASKRVAAFAAAKDYVILATREDVLAGALSLLAGQAGPSVAGEGWFDTAVRAAKAPGELRMAMNLDKLTKSPHFRSYWIQQNITELKQYTSAVSDASRTGGDMQEDRVLLRGAEVTPSWNEAAVGEVVRYAPASAGIYRAWASPTAQQALELLRRKILESRSAAFQIPSKTAPVVNLGDGTVGAETDLETRIDEPPLASSSEPAFAALGGLLNATKIDSMLYAGATRVQQDGVFVATDSGVALIADTNWDSAAVRNALTDAFSKLLSANQLGLRWQERRSGANVYYEIDGLAPIALAANGRVLLIASGKELLEAMLAGSGRPPGAGAYYAALYRHSQELPNFVKTMRLIDAPLTKDTPQDAQPEPAFFSGNIASLGQVLGRIDSESITVHDAGTSVNQTVLYRMKR